MSKIDRLTPAQESLLPVYHDKWLAIGLSTQPANRAEAQKGIIATYNAAGLQPPKIVWCLSPLTSGLTRFCVLEMFKSGIGESVWDSVRDSVGGSVRDSVWDSVGDSVGDSVRDSVWDSVGASVRASVRASVWDSVGASVRASVRASVGDSVWDSVWDSVRASVRASVRDSVYGQHESHWLGFYDYFNNVLGLVNQTKKLSGLWIVAQNAGWFLPHENICWISERHNICKLKDGKIHSETGPAIAYPDGFEIYGLNGVRVPKIIVTTPAEELDPIMILKEQNAEIRREIVRKIGIERVCQKLGATVLEKGVDHIGQPCELLTLDLNDNRRRPYIKLMNPSVPGVYHLEGVPPECDTLVKAFAFRNGTEERPVIVT